MASSIFDSKAKLGMSHKPHSDKRFLIMPQVLHAASYPFAKSPRDENKNSINIVAVARIYNNIIHRTTIYIKLLPYVIMLCIKVHK